MDSPSGLGGKLLPSRHPAVGVWQLRRVGPPSTVPNSASLIRLCEDGQVTIGRGPTADYFVDSAITLRLISRIHASIIGEKQPNGPPKFTIVNSGLNGTYINDYKMGYHSENRQVLHEGDKITFGHPGCASIQPGELAPQHNSEFQFILEHVSASSSALENREPPPRATACNGGFRYNLLPEVDENSCLNLRKQEVGSVIESDHSCPRLSDSPQSNASTSEKENVLTDGEKCGLVRNTRSPTFDTPCAIFPSKYNNIPYHENALDQKDEWSKKVEKKSGVQGLMLDHKTADSAYDILSSSVVPPKCVLFNGVHEVVSAMHKQSPHSQSSAGDSYKCSPRHSHTTASAGTEELTKMSPSLFRTDGGGIQVNSTTIVLRDDDNCEEYSCDDASSSSPEIEFVGTSSWIVPTRVKVESISDDNQSTPVCGVGKTYPCAGKKLSFSKYAGSEANAVRSRQDERDPSLNAMQKKFCKIPRDKAIHPAVTLDNKPFTPPVSEPSPDISLVVDRKLSQNFDLRTCLESSSVVKSKSEPKDSVCAHAMCGKSLMILPASDYRIVRGELLQTAAVSSSPSSPETAEDSISESASDDSSGSNKPSLSPPSSSSSSDGPVSPPTLSPQTPFLQTPPNCTPHKQAPNLTMHSSTSSNSLTPSSSDSDSRHSEASTQSSISRASDSRPMASSNQSGSSLKRPFIKDVVPHMYSSSDEDEINEENRTKEIVKKIFTPRKSRQTKTTVDTGSDHCLESAISELNGEEHFSSKVRPRPSSAISSSSSSPSLSSKATPSKKEGKSSPHVKIEDSDSLESSPSSSDLSDLESSMPKLSIPPGSHDTSSNPRPQSKTGATHDQSTVSKVHRSQTSSSKPAALKLSPSQTSKLNTFGSDRQVLDKSKPKHREEVKKLDTSKTKSLNSSGNFQKPPSKSSPLHTSTLKSSSSASKWKSKPELSRSPPILSSSSKNTDSMTTEMNMSSLKTLPKIESPTTAKLDHKQVQRVLLSVKGLPPDTLTKSPTDCKEKKTLTKSASLKTNDTPAQGGSSLSKLQHPNPGLELSNKSSKSEPRGNNALSKSSKTATNVNNSLSKSSKTAPHVNTSLTKSSKTAPQVNTSLTKSSKTAPQVNTSLTKSSKTAPHVKSATLTQKNMLPTSAKLSSDYKTAPGISPQVSKSSKPNGTQVLPSKGSNSSPLIISSSSSSTSVVGTPKAHAIKSTSVISLKDDTDFLKALTSSPAAKKGPRQKPTKAGTAKPLRPPEKSSKTGADTNAEGVFKKKNFLQSVSTDDVKRKEPLSGRTAAATKKSSVSNSGDASSSKRSTLTKPGSRSEGHAEDEGKSLRPRESKTAQRGKLSRNSSVSSTNSSTRRKRKRSPSKKGRGRPKNKRKKLSHTSSEEEDLEESQEEEEDEDMNEPSEDWSLPDGVQYYDNLCNAAKCLNPVGSKVDWVMCDSCEQWYHVVCVDCPMEVIQKENIQFHCGLC